MAWGHLTDHARADFFPRLYSYRDSLAHVPAIEHNILKPPSISSITKPSGVPGYPSLFNFKPILGQFEVFNKHPNDNNSEMLFNQVS